MSSLDLADKVIAFYNSLLKNGVDIDTVKYLTTYYFRSLVYPQARKD